MSAITDAQTEATYNAELNNSGYLTTYGGGANAAVVETIVSATPFQVSTARSSTLYIAIATSASITVSMGAEAAGTSVPIVAAAAEAIGLSTFHVPAGFWVKITGTVADFVVTAMLN